MSRMNTAALGLFERASPSDQAVLIQFAEVTSIQKGKRSRPSSAPEYADPMKPHRGQRSSISLAAALAVSLAAALATASSTSSSEHSVPEQTTPEQTTPAQTAPAQTAPAQTPCGDPGAPPCPFQLWMRGNVALPLATNNLNDLADGLERTARLSPDSTWTSWRTIATQGAAAARKGDIAGARASCKGCHDAWREAYKAKHRNRPIPR